MSEITINKHNKSITFINNGIGFSQIGVADEVLDLINNLQTQLQQKENIIKEVRKYIENNTYFEGNAVKTMIYQDYTKGIIKILDKENNDNV